MPLALAVYLTISIDLLRTRGGFVNIHLFCTCGYGTQTFLMRLT